MAKAAQARSGLPRTRCVERSVGDMASELLAGKPGWSALLRSHARQHSGAALGLGFALLAVLALLIQSVAQLASAGAGEGVRLAMLGGMAGFATTALGALPALVLRRLPQQVEDS